MTTGMDLQDHRSHRPSVALCAMAILFAPLTGTAVVAQQRQAPDPKAPEFNQYRIPVTRLQGRPIGDPDLLARPTAIEWLNQRILVLDRRGDQVISVIDATTGRTLRRFGEKGAGPGEFQGAWSFFLEDPASDQFWIFDTGLGRVTRVNLLTDFPAGKFVPGKIFTIVGGTLLTTPQWIARDRLISTGLFSRELLAAFDADGKVLPGVGRFEFGDPRASVLVRQQAYSLRLAREASDGRLILYSRMSDRWDILDASGRRVRTNQRPFGFDPVLYVVGERRSDAAITPDSRYGYRSIKTTATRIYALYSGRREGDFPRDAAMARYVHVYDWDGRLRGVVDLAVDALDISVDPGGEHLWALRHDPTPGLVVYAIPVGGW